MTAPSQPSGLVLASTSPYRRELLARLGLPFQCRSPRIDEEALKQHLGPIAPEDLAMTLAEAKARSLADEYPGDTLIGSDQLVALDDKTLGKPGTAEAAVEQLRAMSGREHRLITTVAVWKAGQIHRHLDIAILHLRPLGDDEIRRYVEADQPYDCAGSYKLESRGITLFDRIQSDDHTAITGLPLIALTTILRNLGHPLP